MIFNHRPEKVLLAHTMFLQSAVQRGFERLADNNSVPWNLPLFIQIGLQQYRGCTFYYPAYCQLSNTICLGTVRR